LIFALILTDVNELPRRNQRGIKMSVLFFLSQFRRVVAEGIKIMGADGDSIPEPLSNKKYSGKFSVRIPPEVHRNLSIQAAEEGVSLNRLISARLAK